MKAEKQKRPSDKCQDIDVNILNPLLRGLKIAGIEEKEIDGNRDGISIAIDNKKGDRVHLIIEPIVEPNGKLSINTSIYSPI